MATSKEARRRSPLCSRGTRRRTRPPAAGRNVTIESRWVMGAGAFGRAGTASPGRSVGGLGEMAGASSRQEEADEDDGAGEHGEGVVHHVSGLQPAQAG